jgi:hypothetical protein
MSRRSHEAIATQFNLTRPSELKSDAKFLSGILHSITVKDGQQVINFIRLKSRTEPHHFYTYTYDPIKNPDHIIEFKMVECDHFELQFELEEMNKYLKNKAIEYEKNKATEDANKANKPRNKYLKYKHKYLMLKQLLK